MNEQVAPAEPAGSRRGRPPSTSARELELIGLRLFVELGFDNTTIDRIAAEAGVSRRTFFRYFDSKAGVLWNAFDAEVANLHRLLAESDERLPIMQAVRLAVLAANHYRAEDVPELRSRIELIGTVPELAATAAMHYDAWERAISSFVAQRTGKDPQSLYAMAVGRTTLAACRAAFDRWVLRADADLTAYLNSALNSLASGFSDPNVDDPDLSPATSR
ncbi:MAG: mycofactocin system transcriptional regulator [Jatrophihabitantaceae bacterium]